MVEGEKIEKKIINDNFLRFKFVSLVFIGFTVFTFLTYLLKVDYWVSQHKDIYLVLDYIFAAIALLSFSFFWFYKKDNIDAKNSFVMLITFLILNWSAVITGVELTSLGFSTYMIVIVATSFFIYLNLLVSTLLYLSSFVAFIISLHFFNHLDKASYPFLFSFFPVVIVSYLISRKNFINKIRTLEQEEELRLLTKKLQYSKSNLEEEVKIRTAKLAQSEAKFRNYVENAHDLIYQLSPEGIFTYVSPNWKDFMGYDQTEVTGEKMEKFIFPEDRSLFTDFLKKVMTSGEKQSGVEYRIIHKDNSLKWHMSNGSPLKDDKGNTISYLGIAHDITEQKKSEQNLIHSHSLMQYIIEHTRSAVAVHDRNFRYIYVSKSYLDQYNIKDKNIIGKHHYDVFPDLPQKWRDVHKKALKGIVSSSEEDDYPKSDGTVEWTRWECRPWYEADGSVGGFVIYTEVITDRKNMELELIKAKERAEENELKFSAAFYTTPDALTLTKLNGEYIDVNEGYTKLSGYTREEVLGKLSSEIDIWHNIQDRKAIVQSLNEKGIVENMEVAFRNRDGELIYCLVSAKIIKIKNQSVILLLAKDISDIKKIQDDLLLAKEKAEQANRLKTEFLHNMSHEVRTPLNGIMGFSEIIEMVGVDEEKRKKYLHIIRSSSKQLLRIIDDILEISNLETKQLVLKEENFSLNDLLTELHSVFNLKAKRRNIPLKLNMKLTHDESFIRSDKSKLIKIVSNLLENALKFTHEGFIELGYYLENKNLVMYVMDTGIGISPENQEIIFERFSQEDKNLSRKYGGLGLGLSISKENAELLGGEISVESEKGKGSTFFVTIPYKPLESPVSEIKESFKENFQVEVPTILIAEDEKTNFIYFEALFEEEPHAEFKLIHAKNGKEAVDICIKSNIDLVLMDLKMPEMDGYEATRRIKADFPNLPILAQTAYSTEADREKALNSGCDDFISKPIDRSKFFELVYKYITKVDK
ncbi:MAG: PAS domain S-box protein [Bacteroidetes bacterium]|nr:PAS domain S-box protein [Bacteroidota bacterium]